MTTKLPDFYGCSTHATLQHLVREGCPTTVEVNTWRNGGVIDSVSVAPDKFLAAVATELDVIIINRADLPKVNSTLARGLRAIHSPTGSEATVRCGDSADDVRGLALCYLAMAEHLEKNPPVDEAEVNALIRAFIDAGARIEDATFEDLVRAGVRAPQDQP